MEKFNGGHDDDVVDVVVELLLVGGGRVLLIVGGDESCGAGMLAGSKARAGKGAFASGTTVGSLLPQSMLFFSKNSLSPSLALRRATLPY